MTNRIAGLGNNESVSESINNTLSYDEQARKILKIQLIVRIAAGNS